MPMEENFENRYRSADAKVGKIHDLQMDALRAFHF